MTDINLNSHLNQPDQHTALQQASQAYIDFFSTLNPEHLEQLSHYFTADARFKDPFNDVTGISAIQHIFQHMFTHTQQSRFVVQHAALDQNTLLLQWDYHFQTLKGKPWSFSGMSRVTFATQDAEQGKVIEHIDYWDPVEGIYRKIPLLKHCMAFLTRRLQAN
ncbi:MAG TPA: nuclear transport factor 2 family protein [Thiothrix sp.]|nr:nuclear transport factor 2 family protein [Thiothrix sp.]